MNISISLTGRRAYYSNTLLVHVKFVNADKRLVFTGSVNIASHCRAILYDNVLKLLRGHLNEIDIGGENIGIS